MRSRSGGPAARLEQGERPVGTCFLASTQAAAGIRPRDDGDVSLDREDVEGACVHAGLAPEAPDGVDVRETNDGRHRRRDRLGSAPGAARATSDRHAGNREPADAEARACEGPLVHGSGRGASAAVARRASLLPCDEPIGAVLSRACATGREWRRGRLVLVEADGEPGPGAGSDAGADRIVGARERMARRARRQRDASDRPRGDRRRIGRCVRGVAGGASERSPGHERRMCRPGRGMRFVAAGARRAAHRRLGPVDVTRCALDVRAQVRRRERPRGCQARPRPRRDDDRRDDCRHQREEEHPSRTRDVAPGAGRLTHRTNTTLATWASRRTAVTAMQTTCAGTTARSAPCSSR